MEVREYERMHALEDHYWWFQGRMRIIRAVLDKYMAAPPRPGRVLDVGCGTGLMLSKVNDWEPAGLDFSRLALDYCRGRGIRHLVRGDVVHLPVRSGSMDLVLALDLIEHIERDDLMAREFHRILRPGGYLMATVPAHQFLWSDHDVALHHYRRYSYDGFLQLLRGAGFRPVKYSYGITFTYLPIVAFRKIQRLWQQSIPVDPDARPKTHLIPLPGPINTALVKLLHLEAALLRHMNLPFGVSLVALCRKVPRRSRP